MVGHHRIHSVNAIRVERTKKASQIMIACQPSQLLNSQRQFFRSSIEREFYFPALFFSPPHWSTRYYRRNFETNGPETGRVVMAMVAAVVVVVVQRPAEFPIPCVLSQITRRTRHFFEISVDSVERTGRGLIRAP